jgi:general secretion pathway protein M
VLAVLLLLVAVAVLVRALLVPIWITYRDNRDAIAQAEDDIARYSRLSTRVDALSAMLAELDQTDSLNQYVLAQESEPLAAAALQDRVKSVVTGSGGTLTSTQVLPAVAGQGFERIIVNVRMAVTMDALQRVLYELESDLPYLLVDDIIILSRGAARQRQTGRRVDFLDVRFNLYGYMRDAGEAA